MKTTYREAIRESIRQAMREDERVFLMGEDVGAYGGSFGVSPSGSGTRRCPSPRSSGAASGLPWAGCGRSSKS